jgi:hypothetical protein
MSFLVLIEATRRRREVADVEGDIEGDDDTGVAIAVALSRSLPWHRHRLYPFLYTDWITRDG